MGDHPGGDGLQEGPEAALRLEAAAERAGPELLQHRRGDPAGDEHAAAGAIGERQVPRDRAQQTAEHLDGVPGARIALTGQA